MRPVLFRLGPFTLYTYTVLLDLGLLLGLVVGYGEARRRLREPGLFLDAAFWALLAGVVGARLNFVAVNRAYFAEHPREALALWKGGLAFPGGLVAGLLGLAIYALRRERRLFWPLADAAAPALAAGGFLGWLGCLMAGCAYGREGYGPLYLDLPDIYGVHALRFPFQPLAAMLCLGLFLLLFLMRHRPLAPGQPFGLYLFLQGTGLFFLEFGRGDEGLYLGSLRLSQWIYSLMALLGLVTLLILGRRGMGNGS